MMRENAKNCFKKAPLVFILILALIVNVFTSIPAEAVFTSSIIKAVAGEAHILYLESDGTVWGSGLNNLGQLGNGTTINSSVPVKVEGLTNVVNIFAGRNSSFAILSNGETWAWGNNMYGLLGDGTKTNRDRPVNISLNDVVEISSGGSFTLARLSSGEVYSWGRNSLGQLGDGTTTDRTMPGKINDLSGITSISAGSAHALALDSNGKVWAWGRNVWGALGDGTYNDRLSPVVAYNAIFNKNKAKSISAGAIHSLCITNNGELLAWGGNESGQLGDGSTTTRKNEVTILSSGVEDVQAGVYHTVILKTDGTIWTCGENSDGQLGIGSTTDQTSPVQVSAISGITQLGTIYSNSTIVSTGSVLYLWGDNTYGQLGDGTTTDRTIPIELRVLYASTTASLTEENLDGAVVTLTLTGDVYASTLDSAHFELQNAPAGVSVSSVSRISHEEAALTLAFDGTDFDVDISNFSISVAANQFADNIFIRSTALNINATVEVPPIAEDNTIDAVMNIPYIFTEADFGYADADGDPLVSVIITTLPTAGSLQLSGTPLTLNQAISKADIDNGALAFVPETGAAGDAYDSFGFKVSDDQFESTSTYTMTMNVAIKVADIIPLPLAGEIDNGDSVALSSLSVGAAIYYTVDGSTPSAASTPYTVPIILNTDTVIKAIGIMSDCIDSSVGVFSYTIKEYSLRYDDNLSDTGAVPDAVNNLVKSETVLLSGNTGTLEKTGYTFIGWNTQADGNGSNYDAGDSFSMPAADVTLYAKWDLNIYSLNYDGNGHTGGSVPAATDWDYGAEATVSNNANNLVRTGFTFNGWNTASDGSGTSYGAGDTFSMPDEDVTLYAQWDTNSYTLSYDGNGYTGGGVPATVSVNYGAEATVSGNTGSLLRTGYTFNGWNTQANGGGEPYSADDTFTMGISNVTLYAQWTINTYDVTYDANNATTGDIPTGNTDVGYGSTVTVADNTGSLTRTGFTFVGWNTAPDGSGTSYNPGGTFFMPDSDVTLYAQWDVNSYTLSYDGNGYTGGNVPVTVSVNYGAETTVSGNTDGLTRTGHTFSGWNTQADSSGTSYSADDTFTMGTGNVTLYAQWTVNQYSLTYDGNGADGGSAPAEIADMDYGFAVTAESNTFSYTGHIFLEWNTAADGSGTTYAVGTEFSMPAHAVTLYAIWDTNVYTLTYDGNGYTDGNIPSSEQVTYETSTTLPDGSTLTRTGYTFSGWNTQTGGDGDSYGAGASITMPAGNVTLYAQWTINSYALSYSVNGGTGSVPEASTDYEYGATVTAANNAGGISKTGYTFKGWSTEADGTGTSYSEGTAFSMPDRDVTLYAQWDINSYTLSYDGNGYTGGSVPETTSWDYDTTVMVSVNPNGLVRAGYTFKGWSITPDGSAVYQGDTGTTTFTMGTANVTLYAVWELNSYAVSYSTNGGTGDVPAASTEYNYGTSVTVLDNTDGIAKTGNTFRGWNTAPDGIGTSYGAGDTFSMPAHDITLYAQWDTNNYTLSYNGNGNTGGGVPATTTWDYGAEATVNDNTGSLTRTGYTFKGWSTTPAGAVEYQGDTGNTTLTIGASNITLYAVWEANTYAITFKYEDGATSTTTKTVTYGSPYGPLPSPTRTGYTFDGWYTQENGAGIIITADSTVTTASAHELYACWDATTCTISFNTDGGTAVDPITQDYGTTIDTAPITARDLYDFVSWYTDDTLTNEAIFPYTITGDATLFAGWTNLNLDIDGDGAPDVNIDTDGDGTPDVNIDTDGDGTADINIDTDGDGTADINIDTDGDGTADVNIDTDDDGTPDVNIDTDGDGTPDVNIDTDGDGTPDVNIDTDDDGTPDVNIDTDGDGTPDVNIDTDGDGTPDVNIDTDDDGTPDVNIDTDGDGTPDVNIDTDGDGTPDVNIDTDGDGTPDVNIDTDDDGTPDVNIDTDGDGTPDVNIDTDGDGTPDVNIDTDDDGTPDVNLDTDGDGTPDVNIDTDGDGTPDVNIDTDGDGTADTNIDEDGDGIADDSGNKNVTTTRQDANIIVNGSTRVAGTYKDTTNSDGQSVRTVTINGYKLQTILDGQDTGANVIISVTSGFDVAESVFTGETVKLLKQNNATMEIRTGSERYIVPASEINIDEISRAFGTDVDLSEITVTIRIAQVTDSEAKVVAEAAAEGGFTAQIPPVAFTISCEYDGQTVSVENFGSFVQRIMELPDGIDVDNITTGVVVSQDGSVYHVPTVITEIDGVSYAVLSSLTNSIYTVIWNPVEFSDIEEHWAKDYVNDMGSRMVVSGVGNNRYEPNRNMTRAEFAAIVVRALGLDSGGGDTCFADVPASAWYAGYVETAYEYGIITGYDASTFGPNDTITREQAMTMISRAMAFTGLTGDASTEVLEQFKDASDISAYALAGVVACVDTGLVTGRSETAVAPQAQITRAEVAVIVQRLLQKSGLIN